ncbi:MAG: DUF262 domain-containing protein [Ruminiclostridium sp.]
MQEACGIMLDFNPREYSIRELYDSYKRKETILSPKFQRRPVWEYKAKSYLIDTILSGFPIPRIFIRERTSLDMSACREIIDGQQRLKTIFDFLNDGFKISKVHSKEYGNKCYSELPEEVRKDFLKYPISAILLIDLNDNEVFDIFARLNTYSVKLNNQELLNSQFFGVYKQLVYRLAQEYRTFWVDSGILSEKAISRMEDAKLVSELLSVIVEEKITSNSFDQSKRLYGKYDDAFEEAEIIESRFKKTLDLFCKIYPLDFSETSYSKLPLFYSTFISLYHMNYPINIFENFSQSVDEQSIPKLRTVLDEIDATVCSPTEELNRDDIEFIETLKKHTTTPDVRMRRCSYIIGKLHSAFE